MKMEVDATEEKIIKATFDIIQSEGVAKAATKRIAHEAGVNEVTVFRKFKNKNNLVEITKEYYLESFKEKMEAIFDFEGDEEIEEYLNDNLIGLLSLSESEFKIIKVGMEETSDIPEKKQLISNITSAIIDKLDEFFKIQIEKGKIRKIDSRVLALMCFSMTFQSVFLWKVYNKESTPEAKRYGEGFLDILYNGIKA